MVSRGALRVQEGNFEYMEFTWIDKKENNVDKDVVFSGQYTLFGINSSVNVTEYVESLHPLLSNVSDEPPPPVATPVTHLVTAKKNNEETKQYIHLLNSTLTAAERTICCILQDYQREDGVEIPEVLQPYMHGNTFLPFKNKLPLNLKPKGRESRNRKRPKVAGLCRVSLVKGGFLHTE